MYEIRVLRALPMELLVDFFLIFFMLSLSLFVFGLIFGSFANALVWRLKTNQTLSGRSMCPECRAMIHWYDNIPVVSFMWLRARCRSCHQPISWQYPTVELAMAFGFVLMGQSAFFVYGVDAWVAIAFWCALWFVLLVITVFDWLYYEIPMVMIWIGLALAVSYQAWRDWADRQLFGSAGLWTVWDSRLLWGLIAGVGAFLVFTALSKGTREYWMGWGDAWIVLLLGVVAGWPAILWVITLGSGIGSIFGLGMLALHRGTLKTQVPFAPLLIAGFWILIGMQIFGHQAWLALMGVGGIL